MKSKILHKKWLLPLGSMVAASIIAVGAWFAVGALRSDTPEVGDIALITDTPEVEDIALITDTPEVEDVALTTDTQESEMTYVRNPEHGRLPNARRPFGRRRHSASLQNGQQARRIGEHKRDGAGRGRHTPTTLYEFEIVRDRSKAMPGGTIYVVKNRSELVWGCPRDGSTNTPLTTLSAGGDTVVLYLDKHGRRHRSCTDHRLDRTRLYGPAQLRQRRLRCHRYRADRGRGNGQRRH